MFFPSLGFRRLAGIFRSNNRRPVWESCWEEREVIDNATRKLTYQLQPWIAGRKISQEEIEEGLERIMGKKVQNKKVFVEDFKLEDFGPFRAGSLWLMRISTRMLITGIWFSTKTPHLGLRADECLVPEESILLFQGMGRKVLEDGRQRFYLFFLWEEKTIYMYWTYDQVTNAGGMNSNLYRFFEGRLKDIAGMYGRNTCPVR